MIKKILIFILLFMAIVLILVGANISNNMNDSPETEIHQSKNPDLER